MLTKTWQYVAVSSVAGSLAVGLGRGGAALVWGAAAVWMLVSVVSRWRKGSAEWASNVCPDCGRTVNEACPRRLWHAGHNQDAR